MSTAPSIVNVGYRSTNYWVLSAGRSRLLVDLGWPGMFATLEAKLRTMDIPLREITHGVATHYHMDHAGCAQELKNAGMRLIVTPEQEPYLGSIRQYIKPGETYLDLEPRGHLLVRCDESRALLKTLGFDGQLVHTPGHSDDSVSLLLDSGEAFTGDLTPPMLADEASAPVVHASWERLHALGARRVFGGHGSVREM